MIDGAFISEVLRRSGRVWRRIILSHFIDKSNYQLSLTPELDFVRYMNAAQGVREASIDDIENEFGQRGLHPAIYLDSFSPPELRRLLLQRGYVEDQAESDIWKYFDLQDALPQAETFLKVPLSSVEHTLVPIRKAAGIFEKFLSIVIETNEGNDLIRKKLEENMTSNQDDAVELLPYLGWLNGEAVTTTCIGIVGDMAFLTLGGTIAASRRSGIFSWARLKCLEVAKAKGCRYVFTNIAMANSASQYVSDKSGFKNLFTNHLWVKTT